MKAMILVPFLILGLASNLVVARDEVNIKAVDIEVRSIPHGTSFLATLEGEPVEVTAWHVAEAQRKCGCTKLGWRRLGDLDIAIRDFDGVLLGPALSGDDHPGVSEKVLVATTDAVTLTTVSRQFESGRFVLPVATRKGRSGSPVLSADGRVVGVLVAYAGCRSGVCGTQSVIEPLEKGEMKRRVFRSVEAQPQQDREPVVVPDRQTSRRFFRSRPRRESRRVIFGRRRRAR